MRQTAIAIAYFNSAFLVKHMILNAGLENPAYPLLTVVFVKGRRDIPVQLNGKPVGRKKKLMKFNRFCQLQHPAMLNSPA